VRSLLYSPKMKSKLHWETVYQQRAPDAVSWYAPHLDQSLAFISKTGLPRDARIMDVGGGEATLVDDLLDSGFRNLAVFDISEHALQVARARLQDRAALVDWVVGDALEHAFEASSVDIWHDRAVFHFMTQAGQRQRYLEQVLHVLKPGGFAIVGAFGPEGPSQCSGLPVARYGAQDLHGEFGERFRLIEHTVDVHTTPWGAPQQFVYCFCRREH
jgi:ubiquinone/menaquinone biosynthesis C-methylase UbiE